MAESYTEQELQEYYDKYKYYQASIISVSLNLHDLIKLARSVKLVNEEPNA